MHADLTRWTFDPAHGYRSVVLQQGRVLLDAEWNEQASIDAHHDEVRTTDLVGPEGGPAPQDGGVGPFGIVDATTGLAPVGATWADLAVTAGRYYVDGVLVESAAPSTLADQPFLELPDEPAEGRWAVHLDVFDRLVTADERPELLESALGGPDTAFRAQTVWQVRLTPAEADQVCSELVGAGDRTPRSLRVRLQDAVAADAPCSITAGGGYTRLENQLYRVEICDTSVQGGTTTAHFVWSRENGSVVAGLTGLDDSPVTGTLARLTVDRTGRDDELSIAPHSFVEVTSPQRQVRGLPGWFAQVTEQVGTELHVTWLAGHPATLADVGGTPLVRRWEGPPRAVTSPAYTALEGGIEVSFPPGGTPAVGDYWLVPARTSRLAYGVAATHGTIEWPWSAAGNVTLPPVGPLHHTAALAVLDHAAAGWTLVGDCRHLFPPVTGLVSIDLVGGDGQEALPGEELPGQVRVVVRNGALPVEGARVLFTTPDGGWLRAPSTPDDPTLTGPSVEVPTDADGVAAVRWRLLEGVDAPSTQTLHVRRLDDVDDPTDVEVVVTGRLSLASQVSWSPPCEGFVDVGSVQGALDRLVGTRTLRLLGGDGQSVAAEGRPVPELVRVVVDGPCGPSAGQAVRATTSRGGAVVALDDGSTVPTTVSGGEVVDAVADGDGVVALAWRPSFAGAQDQTPRSDVLRVELAPDDGERDRAALSVVAQLDPPGVRTEGVHVTELRFFDGTELLNDEVYGLDDLEAARGISVGLDLPVEQRSVQGKPVVRMLLELPWPAGADAELWGSPTWARHTVEIVGESNADGALIVWWPTRSLSEVLSPAIERLRSMSADQLLGEPPLPLLLRFQIDGWAVVGEERKDLHLNGHTLTVIDDEGRTRQELPSTDEVTGGRFETWFWVSDERRDPDRFVFPGRLVVPGRLDLGRFAPEFTPLLTRLAGRAAVTPLPLDELPGRTLGFVERRAGDAGLTLDVVEDDAPDVRRNTVLGTELLPGDVLRVRVSRGAGAGG
ncbi:DUF6519 domain-containing protein [Isoptericola jiangsuensis]|uniref:DUF6519 domain-containing protein n=1 Tax=Isoptericola jiangsuensis TaxID=548579 RepID=UPI003AAAC67B